MSFRTPSGVRNPYRLFWQDMFPGIPRRWLLRNLACVIARSKLLRRGDLLGFRYITQPAKSPNHGEGLRANAVRLTLRFVRNDTKLWVSFSLSSAFSDVESLGMTGNIVTYGMDYLVNGKSRLCFRPIESYPCLLVILFWYV